MSSSARICPLPNSAAFGINMGDAIEHQHVVGGQLGVAGAEQAAVAAFDQGLFIEAVLFAR